MEQQLDAPTLDWGRHYVAVEPTHFRVEYSINPFMDTAVQPDPQVAMLQWHAMVRTLEDLGAEVDVLAQRADAPDMVYAMNLGLGLVKADGTPHVVMSHMRFPERRMEGLSAQPWFAEHGYATSYVGRDGVGAHLEAGDAFAFGDALVVGYGPRTEELALKHLAADLGVRVRGLRITHPGMYHLDLAFCPLDERRALVCPSALDAPSAAALLELVPEPLVLTEEEALTTFCANSVVVGSTVVMPACPPRVRRQLVEWGFDVVIVDVSEFHKGGGSIRCLANAVDITIGRDLPSVPGGEVVLPPLA
ncbi:dimethylarginine dimethylaminohydrolase family protein [Nocardioides lianchengensis]|uniref:N-Dimethylarginine dimethylaminohydrolase n=1 Tax=Nocardioides lianchengensis TaxID=1045774 RepID=A0A1G6KZS5_9ACTN|nr:arginine deiminase family protein [Nocardioides lianchengensis]NYG13755.1 N-dimethylarginine dimethylaminohydrolase [Nocardioides lianchengensis]SDC36331.1 N-Dimethylarginine dimethylaminohydrolase [Nocardioides lianchengensis]